MAVQGCLLWVVLLKSWLNDFIIFTLKIQSLHMVGGMSQPACQYSSFLNMNHFKK